MRSLLLVLLFVATPLLAQPACPTLWGYEAKNGPDRWGQLSKDWERCDTGRRQSPIDIFPPPTASSHLPTLELGYASFPIVVQNTGHDVKVSPLSEARLLVGVGDATLVQFHFHVPAEHPVNGIRAKAELHVVHQSATNALHVIAVLIEEGPSNTYLQQLTDLIPKVACTSVKTDSSFNLKALLPSNLSSYYWYEGSLTTPACDEIVTFYILKDKITATPEQIRKLSIAHGPLGNARPVAPKGHRTIRERK